ncbi:MAG: YitT family protein [Spirochaetia bacterium]|nr:YitT family protein [Spirochaetia bacterium]MCF7952448.1 YitT family protein [Spirochaetales bacterium]
MNRSFFSSIIEYAMITAGSVVTALGIVLFLGPAKIAAGGVSGLAIILYHLTAADTGLLILLMSIPIFFLGLLIFGKRYGFRSLFGTLVLSISVTILGQSIGYQGILPYADRTDILLSALFGGVLTGIGLGVVMKGGSNTGGTDILAQVIQHYTKIPLGTSLMLVDGLIILFSGFVFGVESALFAVITLYSTGQVINLITSGLNYAKMAYIISDKYDEIRYELLHSEGLGGTAIQARGMYTDNNKNIIMAVVKNRKISRLTHIVRHIDPDAFMIISPAHEVIGEGFTPFNPGHA